MRATRNFLAGAVLVLALAAFAAAAYVSGLFIWSTWNGTGTHSSSSGAFKMFITLLAGLFPFLCLGILASVSEWLRRDRGA
jgi:hypothetical protein